MDTKTCLQLTDTHCHIQSVGASTGEAITRSMWVKASDTKPDDVLRRARDAGVTKLICVGCDLGDSELAVEFADGHEGCWASIGIHPHETQHYAGDHAKQERFTALAASAKVIAVGECGLDYFYEHSSKDDQTEILRFQIELALARNLPMIFHVREAFGDFWPVFEDYHSNEHPIRGVLHSFTDTQANLDRAIKHGLYIGVNGIATFTRNPAQQELYRIVPIDRLLLETDAPFLTPTPDRGKICEPYHIRTIAEFLAGQRGETLEHITEATTRNAQQLFGI